MAIIAQSFIFGFVAMFLVIVAACPPPRAHGQVGVGEGPAPELKTRPAAKRIRLVDPGRDDTLYPVNVNNWWGLMNQRGDLVIYPFFEWTDYQHDSLIRAIDNGMTGFLRGNGSWYIDPVWPFADRFQEGRAVVSDGEKYGYIDKSGKLVVPLQYDEALRYRENMAAVRVGDLCGFIDVRGRMVIEPAYARVRSFHQGMAMVQWPPTPAQRRATPEGEEPPPGPIGYINRTGRVAFADRTGNIEDAGDFHDNLARVKVDGKWGYISRAHRMSIDPQFDDARDFHNGLAAVRIDDKWGYIDRSGRMAIAPTYEQGWDYWDDRSLMVRQDGKFGFVNRQGNWLIEPMYAWADPFDQGHARVSSPQGFDYVGLTGRLIWDSEQALLGFVDTRLRERVRVKYDRDDRFNRTTVVPEWREQQATPYLPDYLYEPVLPQPEDQRAGPR